MDEQVRDAGNRSALLFDSLPQACREVEGLLQQSTSTVDLDHAGLYRLVTMPTNGGAVIVTGLPAEASARPSVFGIICVVGAAALITAIGAGIVIIRRQLDPLSQVATRTRSRRIGVAPGRSQSSYAHHRRRIESDSHGTRTLGAALNRMLRAHHRRRIESDSHGTRTTWCSA
ncbi:integral membrane sensor signal transduction histidine kinase domain protein [Mycobacteroides abscessus subsp. bolletii 103]|nr:integral membrane sensor signal transduction histidine kinase domain protein [Mycobacteroides abscessus subsp. bolletii 103]